MQGEVLAVVVVKDEVEEAALVPPAVFSEGEMGITRTSNGSKMFQFSKKKTASAVNNGSP